MEFACGFVYVPPSLSHRELQRSSGNGAKRSALLPPVKPLRPCRPPPPPPSQPDPTAKAQRSAASSPKASGQPGKNQAVGISEPVPLLSSHPGFPKRYETVSSPKVTGSPVTAPFRRTAPAPALPPRRSFMHLTPEYVMVLPSPVSPVSSPTSLQTPPSPNPPLSMAKATDKETLPGNPNVVLISLGKLLSQERAQPTDGEPVSCSQCGSVLGSWQEKEVFTSQVRGCYFCGCGELTGASGESKRPPAGQNDELFLLNPVEQPLFAADSLLLFCIDISGSMSITSKVLEAGQKIHKSRLQYVQDALLECVQKLSDHQPEVRVGLITFSYQVTMHGCNHLQSFELSDAELNDSGLLKAAAAAFPLPPPLSQTSDSLQRQILGLSANGATALGPAALLAITVASRRPGSKVIICTDGKANAKLGNLEEEDNDAHTLLSSTIFYQELGEHAANQGVTVSVLSIKGTDCRLDELGRMADRTGGKVVIASPNKLHSEFEEIIQNRTIATHCAVTLLLPKSLRMKGEREVGHKGTREVGNVNTDTEVTIQFAANDEVAPPAPGSRVFMQLQIRYKKDGRDLLRVFTAQREVTDHSSAVLSSLSLAVIQLNSFQASASLAVRGRFLDARTEGAVQQQLIERAVQHNQSAEDEQTYEEWLKTMEPINKSTHTLIRRSTVISDYESLTDAGAALLITMKHCNRKSILLRGDPRL